MSAVADREMLLIVDNCEHVLDAVAELVQELVARCPGLAVITTTRQPLGVSGEQIYRVPSLSVPEDGTLDRVQRSEAVQLFVERARQQCAEFMLTTDNAAAVAVVCRRLDGIALAIELAAVRLRSLSVQQLEDRLDQRFRLLKASRRDGRLPRQQTLQALIDWSYQLLSTPERHVLACLSVFAASGFDLEAAEAVCTGEQVDKPEVLDHVDGLIDQSLIQADDNAGALRYRLLETVRDYAATKLELAGEEHTDTV